MASHKSVTNMKNIGKEILCNIILKIYASFIILNYKLFALLGPYLRLVAISFVSMKIVMCFPFAITHFLNLLVMQQNVVTFLYHGKIIKCKKIVGLYPTSLSFCGIVVYQPTNNCIRARDPRF